VGVVPQDESPTEKGMNGKIIRDVYSTVLGVEKAREKQMPK
jgi:hypothetical protein